MLMWPHHGSDFSFGDWLTRASTLMHRLKLAVALAINLSRIAQSVLRHVVPFDDQRDEITAGV